MCLEIIAAISPDAKGRVSADRLGKLSGLAVTSRRIGGKPVLHFSVTGSCSCEFLSDDAEFESQVWSLEPSHLPALARAIATLAEECKRFSFLAHWLSGERPRADTPISAR